MPSVKLCLSYKVKDLNIISCKEHLTEGVAGSCFPVSELKSKNILDLNDPIGYVSSLRLRGGGASDTDTEVDEEDSTYDMEIDESISEENLRTILTEAGYDTREVDDIIAGKEKKLWTRPAPQIQGYLAQNLRMKVHLMF